MTRDTFIDLAAVRFDLPLDEAGRIVDLAVPVEAFDEHHEIPADDVEMWLSRIEEDLG